MINLIRKTYSTFRREGFLSVKKKTMNRYKSWRQIKKIDIEAQEKHWNKLKDKYKGGRVFLIGNGPSLNKTPLYLLKNEYKMCFNRFHIMLERLNWVPDFFMTSDNLVLSDLVNEFDKIIPQTSYSFFPGIHFRGDNYIEQIDKFKNAYWTVQLHGKGFSNKLPQIYPGGSVIYEGFQVLKFLGFKEVYLIGVDMNYRVHETAKMLEKKGIDIISQQDDDPNHFDPRYFGKDRKYHQPEKYVIDNTIQDINYIARNVVSDEFRIINVGFDSKLECFPKQDFNKLFGGSSDERKNNFLELLSKVSGLKTTDDLTLSQFPEFNVGCELETINSFMCPLEIALSLINKAIFTHIPVGPFENKYYFIRRNMEGRYEN